MSAACKSPTSFNLILSLQALRKKNPREILKQNAQRNAGLFRMKRSVEILVSRISRLRGLSATAGRFVQLSFDKSFRFTCEGNTNKYELAQSTVMRLFVYDDEQQHAFLQRRNQFNLHKGSHIACNRCNTLDYCWLHILQDANEPSINRTCLEE